MAEVLVKEGDVLKAGDVIARLNVDALQAAVVRAEAGVAEARANEAKYQEQLPQQIAAAEAEIRSAQAQIAGASAKRNNAAEVACEVAADRSDKNRNNFDRPDFLDYSSSEVCACLALAGRCMG